MNRKCLTALVVLLVWVPLLGAKKQVTKYGSGFYMGEVSFPSGHTCIAMRFYVRDAFFFSGLEKVEQSGAIQFRKKSHVVTVFPETLTLKVSAERMACPSASSGAKS